jgi:hypothetical protein
MTHRRPSGERATHTHAPMIDPRVAELLENMRSEEVSLTVGLGMLVQRAAEVEYVFHGLHAHLGGVERPYTDKRSCSAGVTVRWTLPARDR